MHPEQFGDQFRSFLRREPFQPFVIERHEGKPILIDDPEAVVFNGSAVGFIGLDEIYMFRCDDVRDIHLTSQQAAS